MDWHLEVKDVALWWDVQTPVTGWEKSGWGRLMCNTLLCHSSHLPASEQGIQRFFRSSRHISSVWVSYRYTLEILWSWIKWNLLSNCLPMLQLSHTWSKLGLAASCSEVHVEPGWWSSNLTTQPLVFFYLNAFLVCFLWLRNYFCLTFNKNATFLQVKMLHACGYVRERGQELVLCGITCHTLW